MSRFAEALAAILPDATPEEIEAVESVLDIAEGWRQGKLPLAEARALCTAGERRVAMAKARRDRRWPHLMAMLDAMIAADGFVATQHGCFHRRELEDAGARPFLFDGRSGYEFPIAKQEGRLLYASDGPVPGLDTTWAGHQRRQARRERAQQTRSQTSYQHASPNMRDTTSNGGDRWS